MQVILTLLTTFSAAAAAGPVEDALGSARVAIEDAEFEQARTLLEGCYELSIASEDIIINDSVARIDYYLGIVEFYDGDSDDAALGYWRKALIINPSFTWDAGLVADQDARDIFEALRSEIRQREQVPSGVPEPALGGSPELDGLKVFIDGKLMRPIDLVLSGKHLIQVVCPDESFHGMWVELGEAPDYLDLCGIEQSTAEVDVPERGGPSGLQIGLWGGGGALVAGGTALYFLSVGPSYAAIEGIRADPTSYTRAQADTATAEFNRWRLIDGALLGAGVATVGVSFLISDELVLVPTGRGGVLTGRF